MITLLQFILGISLLLLMVFLLTVLSRVNLLTRQIEAIIQSIRGAENKLEGLKTDVPEDES